ncbi:hypothetical protein [Streptomyces albofaciens]|uniref:hypothetical protein n=1 Tax=Streptomyces albofaciens TaxID=66866 RepID=UPI001AD7D292|nr:hypothetical protein [Streptomyces albofaciens]
MGRLRGVRYVRTRLARTGRSRAGTTRRGRLLAAVGAAGAAVVAVTACEPAGGLNTSSVAYTTDQAGTEALKRVGVKVSWLSCTATVPRDQRTTAGATASANRHTVATVDCQGQTVHGSRITITGRVTSEVDGRCVRGRLTARVAGQVVFQVGVLGNCDADEPTGSPRPTVTHTVQPPSSGHTSHEPPYTPPVTVTVTAQPSDPEPDPDPSPSDTCSDDSHDHDGQGGHDGRNDQNGNGHGHDDGNHDDQGNQDGNGHDDGNHDDQGNQDGNGHDDGNHDGRNGDGHDGKDGHKPTWAADH